MDIIRPSGLTALMRKMPRDVSQRLQRASDLVPGLERQFSMKALDNAMRNDEWKLAPYKPESFERLAFPLNEEGVSTHWRDVSDQNVRELRKLLGKQSYGFDTMPYLRLDEFYEKEAPRLFPIPKVAAHEGRHRSRAMAQEGMPTSLMMLRDTSPFPFKSLDDLIKPEIGFGGGRRDPIMAKDVFNTPPFKHGGKVGCSCGLDALKMANGGAMTDPFEEMADQERAQAWQSLKDKHESDPLRNVSLGIENLKYDQNVPKLYDDKDFEIYLLEREMAKKPAGISYHPSFKRGVDTFKRHGLSKIRAEQRERADQAKVDEQFWRDPKGVGTREAENEFLRDMAIQSGITGLGYFGAGPLGAHMARSASPFISNVGRVLGSPIPFLKGKIANPFMSKQNQVAMELLDQIAPLKGKALAQGIAGSVAGYGGLQAGAYALTPEDLWRGKQGAP